MSKRITFSLIAFYFLIIPVLSFASKPPFKFGKVKMAELEMTSWKGDTTVPAVILYDYGYFNGSKYTFTRTTRIKILKKEGLKYGNKKILNNYKSTIRARVYNLEQGKVVEEKLKNKDIYREELSEHGPFLMNFALPNVKVGSVIDIEYSHFWIPSSWYFQQEIPVQWSELIMEPSSFIELRKKLYGFELLDINDNIRWVAKDVPAFKPEPYINSFENYISKAEFDIIKIHAPGYIESFTTSWEDFSDFILDRDYLSDELSANSFLRKIAEEIESSNQTDIEKLEAAYNTAKQVKWNGWHSYRIYSRELKFPWNDEIGNSAEVNMILFKLLEKLKIDCKPVVLSTRDNGMISHSFPSFNRINHVIVYANVDGQTYLMDATEKYSPYNLLPEKCLNYQARTVDRNNSMWINTEPQQKFKELSYYNLTLTEKNTLDGQISYLFEDYAALDFRKNYASFNSEDSFIDDFISSRPGLSLSDVHIKNVDELTQPIEFVCEVKIKDNIDVLGNELFIYPLFYERITENPFKLQDRKYPVDFAYKTDRSVIVNLTLPDNMVFEELPEPAIVQLPDNGGYFSFEYQVFGNKLNIIYKQQINKVVFGQEQYPYLKEFWNQIVNVCSKPVLVKSR